MFTKILLGLVDDVAILTDGICATVPSSQEAAFFKQKTVSAETVFLVSVTLISLVGTS